MQNNWTSKQNTLDFMFGWELPHEPEEPDPASANTLLLQRLELRLKSAVQGIAEVASGLSDVQQELCQMRAAQAEELCQIKSWFTQLQQAFDGRSRVDDEVQRHRNAELKNDILKPIFLSIISALDRIESEAGQIDRFQEQTDHPLVRKSFDWVRDIRELDKTDFRNLLTRFGIEWFRAQRGEPFNPARHKPVAYEETDNRRHVGRIAQHRLHGYFRRSDDWLIRPEVVAVFKAR